MAAAMRKTPLILRRMMASLASWKGVWGWAQRGAATAALLAGMVMKLAVQGTGRRPHGSAPDRIMATEGDQMAWSVYSPATKREWYSQQIERERSESIGGMKWKINRALPGKEPSLVGRLAL